MIEYGDADVMVCGGAEATRTAGHRRLRFGPGLSTRNDDPATASRPGTRTATASCWVKAPA
jgi:3-oxoacyl-[acyl-carrier-protein] synthase II